MAELLCDAQDDAEEATGEDLTLSTAEFVHSKLLLHGLRHEMTAHDAGRAIVVSMPVQTALHLAVALDREWKQQQER
ncbi:hypothetical protein [Streptomyces sp. NPDC001530]|uniref:hypothetical protein n=1 Tax=Streptomyces sp. NPDC001530 TaxID=3364582 RepID=UPI003686430B